MDRKETLDKVRSYQHIIEVKWSEKYRVTYWGDGQDKTITNNDGRRVGKRWRPGWEDVTVVGCGMVGGVGVCHQSVTGVEGAGAVDLRQPARDWGSHSPNHGVEDGDCCGGGRVNKGPACCIGKPYWGVTKKMCDVDQYGAPPMDGSKEDSQASCTRNPYWGAAKKACGVD
jgi:hypothetical protein